MAKLSISPDPKNMNIQAWNFKFWLCVAGCGLVCLAVGRCGLLHHLEMPMKLSLSFFVGLFYLRYVDGEGRYPLI